MGTTFVRWCPGSVRAGGFGPPAGLARRVRVVGFGFGFSGSGGSGGSGVLVLLSDKLAFLLARFGQLDLSLSKKEAPSVPWKR